MDIEDISVIGRSTQGVRLIRLGEDELVATVAKVEKEEEEEDEELTKLKTSNSRSESNEDEPVTSIEERRRYRVLSKKVIEMVDMPFQ